MSNLPAAAAAAIIATLAIIFTAVSGQLAPSPVPYSGVGPAAAVPTGTSAPGPSMGSEPAAPEPFGASAPGPAGLDCTPILFNMSDCLSYVQKDNSSEVPDKNCCPELAGLVESHAVCLCQLLGKPDLSPIPINVSKALLLPSVCKVTTPPPSTCAVLGYPISGLGTPAPAPAGGVEGPGTAAVVPTAGGNDSGASRIGGSAQSLILCLAFAFILTFFF